MNKGFTLIEIMIVVAIMLILSTFGVMSIRDRIEKNAIITTKSQLPTIMRNAIDKSFSDGVARSVTYNAVNSSIDITGSNVAAISYDIPNVLQATMTPAKFTIGEKGEISGLGTATEAAIEVKTKKNNKVIRVRVSNISGLNLGRVVVE